MIFKMSANKSTCVTTPGGSTICKSGNSVSISGKVIGNSSLGISHSSTFNKNGSSTHCITGHVAGVSRTYCGELKKK